MFDGMTSDEIVTAFAVWAVLSAIVALIASSRGRKQGEWFVISLLLSPLIAFIAVVMMKNLKTGPPVTAPASVGGAAPPCPRCGTARIGGQQFCPGCGLDLWADYDAKAR